MEVGEIVEDGEDRADPLERAELVEQVRTLARRLRFDHEREPSCGLRPELHARLVRKALEERTPGGRFGR